MIAKIIVIAVWLAVVVNLIVPFEGIVGTVLCWTGLFLVVAHAIECVVFRKQIHEHHKDNVLVGYLMVFIFGVVHAGQWQK